MGRVSALLVALGAAVGSPLRFLVGLWLDRRLHWGTLAVNLAGSFVLGLLVGAAVEGRWLALLGVGCGGLTTYSAFAVQSVQAGQRRRRSGAAYVVMTIAGCLAVATLGHLLATD